MRQCGVVPWAVRNKMYGPGTAGAVRLGCIFFKPAVLLPCLVKGLCVWLLVAPRCNTVQWLAPFRSDHGTRQHG